MLITYYLNTKPSLNFEIDNSLPHDEFINQFLIAVGNLLNCSPLIYDYGEDWIQVAEDGEHLNYYTFLVK